MSVTNIGTPWVHRKTDRCVSAARGLGAQFDTIRFARQLLPATTMERVAEWLKNLKVIDKDVACYIRTLPQLAEELQDGVILARIAAELEPNLNRDSPVSGTVPFLRSDSVANANLFLDAYRQRFREEVVVNRIYFLLCCLSSHELVCSLIHD